MNPINRLLLCSLTVVGVFALISAAPAARKVSAHNSAAANSPLAPIIQELHQTHQLLAGALHDYKGHRARAMADINKAIQQLHTHPLHKHGTKTHHAASTPPPGETQPQSDAKLVQAGKQLNVILQQLTSVNQHPAFANHPNIAGAAGFIQQATQQLGVALSIK